VRGQYARVELANLVEPDVLVSPGASPNTLRQKTYADYKRHTKRTPTRHPSCSKKPNIPQANAKSETIKSTIESILRIVLKCMLCSKNAFEPGYFFFFNDDPDEVIFIDPRGASGDICFPFMDHKCDKKSLRQIHGAYFVPDMPKRI